METKPAQVVSQFLNAVKVLDLAQVGSLLDVNVKWAQPGANEISGFKSSQGEVFAMVDKMFKLSGNSLKLAGFDAVSVNGNRVACQLHWTAEKPSGEILDISNIDIYTVSDGKLTEVEVFSADQEQEDNFWKS
jgi:uncharacterized protein